MSGKYGGGGKKCTICGKTVYAGEMVTYEKKVYHVKCFRCSVPECKKKITPAKCEKNDDKLYCIACYRNKGFAQKSTKVVWKKGQSSGTNTGSRKFGGGGKKCVLCGKTAFLAEQIIFEKKIYHVSCFRCSKCNKKNTVSDTVADKDTGKLYCKKCAGSEGVIRKQLSSTKNWKKSSGGGGGSSRFGGGGKKCVVCGKTAFTAEQVIFDKKVYHQKCFRCADCSKKLSPSQANAFKDKIYCPKCFASGGYTQKQTASTRSWKSTTGGSGRSGKYGGGGKKCKKCGKTVFAGEAVTFEKSSYHPGCFKCDLCSKKMASANANLFHLKNAEDATKLSYEWEEKDGTVDVLICRKCFAEKNVRNLQAKQNKWKKNTSKGTRDKRFNKFGGGGIKCTVCAKTVYPAELISFEKHPFHAKCFACKNCSKRLKPGSATHKKHPDGKIDIYCEKCFTNLRLNRADVHAPTESKKEPEEPVKEPEEPVKEPEEPEEPVKDPSDDLEEPDEDSGARDTLD